MQYTHFKKRKLRHRGCPWVSVPLSLGFLIPKLSRGMPKSHLDGSRVLPDRKGEEALSERSSPRTERKKVGPVSSKQHV